MKCPNCEARLRYSARLFLGEFRCDQCSVRLHPSREYVGVSAVACGLLSVGPSIELGWTWDAYPLSLLTIIPFFIVWVNTVPYIVSPTLELREFGPFTTLEIGKKDESNRR